MAEGKRGRPKKAEEDKIIKQVITLRLDPEVVENLDNQAKMLGISRNSLIADLLSGGSYREIQSHLSLAFGGPAGFALCLAYGRALNDIREATHKFWDDDPFTAEKSKEAFDTIFNQLRPKGKAEPPQDMVIPPEHLGAAQAFTILGKIKQSQSESRSKSTRDFIVDLATSKVFSWIHHFLGANALKRIGRN